MVIEIALPAETFSTELSNEWREFLTNDFSLTWMWGEYQSWVKLESLVSKENEEGLEVVNDNLERTTCTLKALLYVKNKQELPEGIEIKRRIIDEIIETFKDGNINNNFDPEIVINERLNHGGGRHLDKMHIDVEEWKKLCKEYSIDWQDAYEALDLKF